MRTAILLVLGIVWVLFASGGCASAPMAVGASAVGGVFSFFSFSSLKKHKADDTFLVEEEIVREAVLQALDAMSLQVDETQAVDSGTILNGSAKLSKSSIKFTATILPISPTVTKVTIKAGRGILSTDYSTAEEIMNQVILRLAAAGRAPDSEQAMVGHHRVADTSDGPDDENVARRSTAAPYVVQVASYKRRENAERHVAELDGAYVVPADIPNKGRWYRVLMRRFHTIEEARQSSQRLMTDGLADLAFPVHLPFAIEVGRINASGHTSELAGQLSSRGLFPYVLPVDEAGSIEPTYHILIGAFTSHQEALHLSRQLHHENVPNRVVTP